MKNSLKRTLQLLLGFERYLFVFAWFKIHTLRWDKKENDFFHFLKLVPENTLLLDIGANIGVMSALLAKRVKQSTVYAFEPVPWNIKTLKSMIRYFGLENVKVFELALGNEEREAEIVMPVIASVKMHGLSHVLHESIPEHNEGEKFKTRMVMLDHLPEIKQAEKKIGAIKMDVENYEYFVLEGARETLNKYKPIVYTELWENENRKKCFSLMRESGYETFVFADGLPVPYIEGKHITQNFVFLPQK